MNSDWTKRLLKNANDLFEEAEILFTNNKFRRALYLQITSTEQLMRAARLLDKIPVNPKDSHAQNLKEVQEVIDGLFLKILKLIDNEELKNLLLTSVLQEKSAYNKQQLEDSMAIVLDSFNEIINEQVSNIKLHTIRMKLLYEDPQGHTFLNDDTITIMYKFLKDTNLGILNLPNLKSE